MASISLSVRGPSFTISLVVCTVSSDKATEKPGWARPSREEIRVAWHRSIKEEDPGEGLFQLSSGSIQPGSGDTEWLVLMICLDLSRLLYIHTLREEWEREVWLWECSWAHLLAAGIKAVRRSQPPMTLHAGFAIFLSRGIYVGSSSLHVSISSELHDLQICSSNQGRSSRVRRWKVVGLLVSWMDGASGPEPEPENHYKEIQNDPPKKWCKMNIKGS